MAFSPDGILVATAANDGFIRLWRASDGGLNRVLTNPSPSVRGAIFAPDSQTIATFSDESRPPVRLWRVRDGVELWSGGIAGTDLAFSPDGTLLVGAHQSEYGYIYALRASDGTLIRPETNAFGPYIGFSGSGYHAVAFSPDGAQLAANIAGGVRFFRVADWAIERTVTGYGAMVAYSPDGRAILLPGWNYIPDGANSAYAGVITVDVRNGSLQRAFFGHAEPGRAAAFTPNGKWILSTSQDNTLRIWRVANGKLLTTYDQDTAGAGPIAIAPDGRSFAYGRDDGALIVARMPVHIHRIARREGATIIEWEGPGGPYQLQQCKNLSADVWHNLGEPTTATSMTNSTTAPVFYRVQDLGNP